MKTLSKKILTVCLALMMAVVMAVPAFARTEGEYSVSSRAYRFNVGDGATFLNLTGDVGANLYMCRLSLYRTIGTVRLTTSAFRMMSMEADLLFAKNGFHRSKPF